MRWQSFPRQPQDLSLGSYFGARRPEDGRIDWGQGGAAIHNLVRGVAPPYPGAFTKAQGRHVRILRTLPQPGRRGPFERPALYCEHGRCYAQCGDGSVLRILSLEVDGTMLGEDTFERAGRTPPVFLDRA